MSLWAERTDCWTEGKKKRRRRVWKTKDDELSSSKNWCRGKFDPRCLFLNKWFATHVVYICFYPWSSKAAPSRPPSPLLLLSSLYVHKNVQERRFFQFLLLLLGWRDTLGFRHCKSERIFAGKIYHIRHDLHENYRIMRPLLFSLIVVLHLNSVFSANKLQKAWWNLC